MESISAIYTLQTNTKAPPHEVSATVALIESTGVMTKKYGWGYWLRMVKKYNVSFTTMEGIIKEMKSLDDKYNKGGWLTNRIRK